MRYQVPQFLEVEDKIFGPLTIKQFLYTAAGAAIAYMAWNNLPVVFAVLIGGPILALFLGLAFYKVNNRPLALTLENGFKYLSAPKLFIWKKREKTPEKKVVDTVRAASNMDVPTLSGSKLKDLSWGLDIHETLETLSDLNK